MLLSSPAPLCVPPVPYPPLLAPPKLEKGLEMMQLPSPTMLTPHKLGAELLFIMRPCVHRTPPLNSLLVVCIRIPTQTPSPQTHSAAHVQVWHAVVEALGVGSGHGAGQVSEASQYRHRTCTSLISTPPHLKLPPGKAGAELQRKREERGQAPPLHATLLSLPLAVLRENDHVCLLFRILCSNDLA